MSDYHKKLRIEQCKYIAKLEAELARAKSVIDFLGSKIESSTIAHPRAAPILIEEALEHYSTYLQDEGKG